MEGEPREMKPGYYTVELNRTVWAVPVYYQNLTPVGTGAYGTVWWVVAFLLSVFDRSYFFICCERVMFWDASLSPTVPYN